MTASEKIAIGGSVLAIATAGIVYATKSKSVLYQDKASSVKDLTQVEADDLARQYSSNGIDKYGNQTESQKQIVQQLMAGGRYQLNLVDGKMIAVKLPSKRSHLIKDTITTTAGLASPFLFVGICGGVGYGIGGKKGANWGIGISSILVGGTFLLAYKMWH